MNLYLPVTDVSRTVQETLCKLKGEEKDELKNSHFWRKAERLLQAKVSMANYAVKLTHCHENLK